MVEKSLIDPKKISIFTKIRNFFMNIFNKKEEVIIEDIEESKIEEQENNYIKEKNKIFVSYNNMRKGVIDAEGIPDIYLDKIQRILQEEINIRNKMLDKLIIENSMLENEISKYEKQFLKNSNKL